MVGLHFSLCELESLGIIVMGIVLFFFTFLLNFGCAAASSRLDVIDLPLGFSPEGITNGDEWTAYVGSLIGELTS